MEKEVENTKSALAGNEVSAESNTNKGMKINISLTSAKIIEAKVLELRQAHCAVSPSKLVDAILDIFIEKYFDKESERLKHYLFDEKRFVRSLLKQSLTTEEFEKALKDIRKKS
jgi:hypothetical protein